MHMHMHIRLAVSSASHLTPSTSRRRTAVVKGVCDLI
jgi:hypothetical protein